MNKGIKVSSECVNQSFGDETRGLERNKEKKTSSARNRGRSTAAHRVTTRTRNLRVGLEIVYPTADTSRLLLDLLALELETLNDYPAFSLYLDRCFSYFGTIDLAQMEPRS